MKLKNYAAYLPAEKAALIVKAAPFPTECGDNELIIHNRVIAVNPVDWKIQDNGGPFNIEYPAILGEDVAGEVLHVGSKVKQFKVGDRVIAHATRLGLGRGDAYAGFQTYPTVTAALTAAVPDYIPLETAAVLPLSISTAAAGLYLKSTLSLRYPTLSSDTQHKSTQKPATLLLWGGSSSVGSSVLQLASASGYQVITTASPSNYAYCKKLGAAYVLDYHNPDTVDIVTAVLHATGTEIAGAYDAIGSESTVRQCASVLHALGGGTLASVGSAPQDLPDGVEVARIGSSTIVSEEPEVAEKVWGEYVPEALEAGELVPSPEPLVVGKGLQSVQKGLDRQKEGVSARKVEIVL
ncbi:MAG: hypothetical protein Q9227_004823 [Pyrenula ochraceoflavens]